MSNIVSMKVGQGEACSPSIALIVNSCDDERYRLFTERFLEKITSLNVEVIRIPNAVSMAEGYNRGALYAQGEWLIFCHDDIGVLGNEITGILLHAMKNSDVFGPCGTRKLVSGNWYDAGQPYTCGAVVAPDYNRKNSYQLELFGKSTEPLCMDIQALDGLFIACKRRVFDSLKGFDEVHLHGFHTYDIDFTFRAYLAGFKCVVANNMVLLHDSNVAEFTEEKLKEWASEQSGFVERFRKNLSVKQGVRRHDVVSLDKPEDGVSVRQEVCRLDSEGEIFPLKSRSVGPFPKGFQNINAIRNRLVCYVKSVPILRTVVYFIMGFVRR